ncbi:hypothetical protein FDECE_15330 [Fusarium decemcellulare]|nr:hypothetical protein FDECE_15330 [Fusarium decemcellulare]
MAAPPKESSPAPLVLPLTLLFGPSQLRLLKTLTSHPGRGVGSVKETKNNELVCDSGQGLFEELIYLRRISQSRSAELIHSIRIDLGVWRLVDPMAALAAENKTSERQSASSTADARCEKLRALDERLRQL